MSNGTFSKSQVDEAMRLYQEGSALDSIAEATGLSIATILAAKKRRGIPDRNHRADGTIRKHTPTI